MNSKTISKNHVTITQTGLRGPNSKWAVVDFDRSNGQNSRPIRVSVEDMDKALDVLSGIEIPHWSTNIMIADFVIGALAKTGINGHKM